MFKLKGQMTVRTRVNLSYQHMQEAIHFAHLSKESETINAGKTFSDGDYWNHHRAYVVGAIMTSVASVEAHINEFYLDAVDNHLGAILDHNQQNLLAELWKPLEQKRVPILEKYQIALAAIKCTKFDTSKGPYQDIDLLINLRNMLVHFKPEWDNALKEHKKIEDKLRGKFELNPFLPKENTRFFPFKCLSYGCASWAVKSSIDFILEFLSSTELNPKHQKSELWKKLVETF